MTRSKYTEVQQYLESKQQLGLIQRLQLTEAPRWGITTVRVVGVYLNIWEKVMLPEISKITTVDDWKVTAEDTTKSNFVVISCNFVSTEEWEE